MNRYCANNHSKLLSAKNRVAVPTSCRCWALLFLAHFQTSAHLLRFHDQIPWYCFELPPHLWYHAQFWSKRPSFQNSWAFFDSFEISRKWKCRFHSWKTKRRARLDNTIPNKNTCLFLVDSCWYRDQQTSSCDVLKRWSDAFDTSSFETGNTCTWNVLKSLIFPRVLTNSQNDATT